MSKPGEAPNNNRVIELKAAAHLMTLDAGVFCVYHAPNQAAAGPEGLPGVRISDAPGTVAGNVAIKTFADDGWIGATGGAALIRVLRAPAQVLVTTYQAPNSATESPRLQVVQLAGAAAPAATAPRAPQQAPAAAPVEASASAAGQPSSTLPGKAEIAAHIQRRGDVLSRIGEWMGSPGSQFWIEGFGIAPTALVPSEDIEYQAVLGKGWLSPWAEGGQYCGSRGMALPILGLRVRVKGESAKSYRCRVTATFTDGTRIGPVDESMAAEAESLAPLEAFLIELVPAETAAPKSGRGRKPAVAAPEPVAAPATDAVPRRRGRPPKAASVPAPVKAAAVKTAPVKVAGKTPTGRPVASPRAVPTKGAAMSRGKARR